MTAVRDYENMMFSDEHVFVHACYLPSKKTNVIMKPGAKHGEAFSYQTFFLRPRLKNVPCNLKLVKKVEVKKVFSREHSIFHDFKAESKQLYKKCFEYDIKFTKLARIIKDVREVMTPVFLIHNTCSSKKSMMYFYSTMGS